MRTVDYHCWPRVSEAMKLIKVQYETILAIDSIVTEEDTSQCELSMEQIKEEYGDVFTDNGCLEVQDRG